MQEDCSCFGGVYKDHTLAQLDTAVDLPYSENDALHGLHTPRCACLNCIGTYGPVEERSICIVDSPSIPDTGKPSGHNNPEVGLHAALQYLADASQRDLRRSIRNFLQTNVSNQAQGVVQDQEGEAADAHSLSPKPAPAEQVRPDVSQEEGIPGED